VSSTGTGGVQTGENYLGCHIHVNTLVSWWIQSEVGGYYVTVPITNGPVYMCDRVSWGRKGWRLVRDISDVIYT
jgi:hypothetical protein